MPSGCQTITVSGASVSDVNGSYTFDATTEAWINDNNVDWSLQKTWWEANALGAGVPATSGFRWSFIFSGTSQPPGAVTTRMLVHPTLLGGVGANDTGNWAKNSTADGNTSFGSAEHNPTGVNGWHYMPPQYIDITRYQDAGRTILLDTGTIEVLWPAQSTFPGGYMSNGVRAMTVLEWAVHWTLPANTKIEFSNNNYDPANLDISPPSFNFILKDEVSNPPNHTWNTYWESGWSNTQNVPTGAQAFDTPFDCTTTGNSATRGNYVDYWTVTPRAPIDILPLREFNHLVYPDKDTTTCPSWGPNVDYELPYADVSPCWAPYYWNSTAPWVNLPVNLGTSGDSPPGAIDAGNLLQIAWGSTWGIDLGMAPDGGETCPSDATWSGGISVSAGTGSAPSAPTTFAATVDLTSIPPSAPTTFTAAVDLTSIPPSAPTWDAVVADSDGTPPDDLTDDFPLDPNVDTDSDGDFIPDEFDAFPSNPTEWLDTDGDGTGDNADTPTGRPDNGNDPGEVWPNWVGWTKAPKYRGYVYDEKSRSLSGPFVSGDLTALTSVRNGGSLLGVSSENKIVSTDLVDFRDRDFPEPLTDPWKDIRTHPSSDCDCFVVGNKGGRFAYRGRYLESPFAAPKVGSFEIGDPMCFTDGHLAIAETAWMHLGNEHNNKQVHRLDFNFSTGSYGHVWAYIQSDSEQGKVSGQYKGLIKDNVRVFVNVRGRRFRVRLFVATHKSYPWNLREMAVGYLVGKSF